MPSHGRVEFSEVERGSEVLTPEFLDLLVGLYDQFVDRVHELRRARHAVLKGCSKMAGCQRTFRGAR